MQLTKDQRLRHIKALRMLCAGPAEGEQPATFARRLIAAVGPDVHQMVMERIRTGVYPSADAPAFTMWARHAIDLLSQGMEPRNVVRYACGWPITRTLTCALTRGHTGSHAPSNGVTR